ncbi:MAG TPA: hypothetical protein VFF28_02150 [Candidatus Nanoarchaeia archaeon]|nr:hypothetical protein [Candidatus Nanoarchaeia archaeon]
MDIISLLDRLEKDQGFIDWKKKNQFSYLAHVFKLLDDANIDDWQIGYYNNDDTITTFIITPQEIKVAETENIFKKPDAKINKLDVEKIKIDIAEALQTAEKIQAKEYKNETPFKIITILQNLDIGQVYNITYVTQSFKVLNLKIDSTDGKVLAKSLKSVMDFKAS